MTHTWIILAVRTAYQVTMSIISIEDREGNLWVATSRGIDNFRDTRVDQFYLAVKG